MNLLDLHFCSKCFSFCTESCDRHRCFFRMGLFSCSSLILENFSTDSNATFALLPRFDERFELQHVVFNTSTCGLWGEAILSIKPCCWNWNNDSVRVCVCSPAGPAKQEGTCTSCRILYLSLSQISVTTIKQPIWHPTSAEAKLKGGGGVSYTLGESRRLTALVFNVITRQSIIEGHSVWH